ncbi:MAG: hypothetical protein HYZ83_01275 [Candidatus Omnitrophica bacterium]|nr:hypothetical protein [Candidatus Omnitrophota bacterium]
MKLQRIRSKWIALLVMTAFIFVPAGNPAYAEEIVDFQNPEEQPTTPTVPVEEAASPEVQEPPPVQTSTEAMMGETLSPATTESEKSKSKSEDEGKSNPLELAFLQAENQKPGSVQINAAGAQTASGVSRVEAFIPEYEGLPFGTGVFIAYREISGPNAGQIGGTVMRETFNGHFEAVFPTRPETQYEFVVIVGNDLASPLGSSRVGTFRSASSQNKEPLYGFFPQSMTPQPQMPAQPVQAPPASTVNKPNPVNTSANSNTNKLEIKDIDRVAIGGARAQSAAGQTLFETSVLGYEDLPYGLSVVVRLRQLSPGPLMGQWSGGMMMHTFNDNFEAVFPTRPETEYEFYIEASYGDGIPLGSTEPRTFRTPSSQSKVELNTFPRSISVPVKPEDTSSLYPESGPNSTSPMNSESGMGVNTSAPVVAEIDQQELIRQRMEKERMLKELMLEKLMSNEQISNQETDPIRDPMSSALMDSVVTEPKENMEKTKEEILRELSLNQSSMESAQVEEKSLKEQILEELLAKQQTIEEEIFDQENYPEEAGTSSGNTQEMTGESEQAEPEPQANIPEEVNAAPENGSSAGEETSSFPDSSSAQNNSNGTEYAPENNDTGENQASVFSTESETTEVSAGGPDQSEVSDPSGSKTVSYWGDYKLVETSYTSTTGPENDKTKTTGEVFSTFKWDYKAAAWILESKSGHEHVYKSWDLTTGTQNEKGSSSKSYSLFWAIPASGGPYFAEPTKTLQYWSFDKKRVVNGQTTWDESWTIQGDDIYTQVGYRNTVQEGDPVHLTHNVVEIWSEGGRHTREEYTATNTLTEANTILEFLSWEKGVRQIRTYLESRESFVLVNDGKNRELVSDWETHKVYDKNNTLTFEKTAGWSVAGNSITYSLKLYDRDIDVDVSVVLDSKTQELKSMSMTDGGGAPISWPAVPWNDEFKKWFQQTVEPWTGLSSPSFPMV